VFVLSVIVGGLYELYRVLRDQREEARRERGLCPRCGYDMRASRRYCPECGLPTRAFPHPHLLHN
jgi:predicted amidophosphoribosyltransferase